MHVTGVPVDSSWGYIEVAKQLIELKCPTIGIRHEHSRSLSTTLGSRASEIIEHINDLDRRSREQSINVCHLRLHPMGWTIRQVLIVDHLGSGVWASHQSIKKWFQLIGIIYSCMHVCNMT